MRELGAFLLSHHHADELDRCVVVAGHHLCRRCLVLYPVAFTVMALALVGPHLPVWSMLVLPIGASIELIAERLGRIGYDARRQVAVTLLAAPALGAGFARVAVDPVDRLFWAMVGVHAVPVTVVIAVQALRTSRQAEAARVAREEADPVLADFGSAEQFRAYLDAAALRLGLETTVRSEPDGA